MKYIESPEEFGHVITPKGALSIFLAGGITDCPDWQQEMRGLLVDTNFVLFNPRRENFPIHDPNAAKEQIGWEYRHLGMADEILFWFPCETLCPIVLFELGRWSFRPSQKEKPIHIGVHPDYSRRQDVEIQIGLIRPEVGIVYSLETLAQKVIHYSDTGSPRAKLDRQKEWELIQLI